MSVQPIVVEKTCKLSVKAYPGAQGEFGVEVITEEKGMPVLRQKATFRPFGIWGRLYWYMVLPLHFFVFNGMIRNIERFRANDA